MGTIITAVLFSVPGFFVNKIQERLFPSTRKNLSDIDKTVSAIIYSTFIILINLIIISILNIAKILNVNINDFSQLQSKLQSIDFFIKYLCLSGISSIVVVLIKEYIVDRIILNIVNLKNVTFNGGIEETKYNTVWDSIFENNKEPIKDSYVSIEKDGELITQGVLDMYSHPGLSKKEFKLIESQEFKRYLEADKILDKDKKLLDKVDMEYFDMETGVLIKFYNTEKLNNYLTS